MQLKWISVEERLPELSEVVRFGHYKGDRFIIDFEKPRSKEVIVAEKKGDGYEEDTGFLLPTGWATDCDYVTHWRPFNAA